MPKMLALGATGKDVVRLQELLNQNMPAVMPPLVTDGIFGPKTLARVRAFQTASGLAVDGIVGPQTWGALEAGVAATVPDRTGCNCGQHDPTNRGIGEMIKTLYFRMVNAAAALGLGAMDNQGTGTASAGSGPLRMLTDPQKATLQPYFGDSIDYSTVFISDKSGAQGRPFTVAFPDTNQTVQIINAGSFAPSDRTLIHEMMHVWQSQHHSDKYAFMKAAVKCQAAAAAANVTAAANNPMIALNSEWPVQYPFSAYAYSLGTDLDGFGAEQAANAVEHGNSTVCKSVKAAGKNSVNSKNTTSLTLTQYGDRRTAGIVY